MRASRTIDLAFDVVYLTVVCAWLLFGTGALLFSATVGFALGFLFRVGVFRYLQARQARSPLGRELAWALVMLVVLVVLVTQFQPVLHHPAFVVPCWSYGIWRVYMRWQKERKLADA